MTVVVGSGVAVDVMVGVGPGVGVVVVILVEVGMEIVAGAAVVGAGVTVVTMLGGVGVEIVVRFAIEVVVGLLSVGRLVVTTVEETGVRVGFTCVNVGVVEADVAIWARAGVGIVIWARGGVEILLGVGVKICVAVVVEIDEVETGGEVVTLGLEVRNWASVEVRTAVGIRMGPEVDLEA